MAASNVRGSRPANQRKLSGAMSRLSLSFAVSALATFAAGAFFIEAVAGQPLAWLPLVFSLIAGIMAALDVRRIVTARDDAVRAALVAMAGGDYEQHVVE